MANNHIEISGNISAKQASKYLSIGISTYWLYVKNGRIKKPIKHGARISVWQASYIKELSQNGIPDADK